MLAFYGTPISKNRTYTPEGFLVALNCPIARTGTYQYLGSEIGLGDSDKLYDVFRPPEEVFSVASIASFNGKSITDEHPPTLLDANNNGLYEKGTVINVRQGTGDESDLLLGDLVIKDPQLIKEIESEKKKEISCGYEFICAEDEKGNIIQRQIRGNHVAIVENGRAGSRVAVKDNSINSTNLKMEGEKKKMSKVRIPKKQKGPVTNFFAALGLKHYAQDAEPQDIAEAVDALAEEREDEPEEAPKEAVKDAEIESPEQQQQENNQMAAMQKEMAELKQMIMQLAKGAAQDQCGPEKALDDLIDNLSGNDEGLSDGDEETSKTVPVEEMDEGLEDGYVIPADERTEDPIKGNDSMVTALKAMRKVISKIPDANTRKVACDSLIAEFKKSQPRKSNGYSNIIKAQRQASANRQQVSDSAEDKSRKLQEDMKKRRLEKISSFTLKK